MGTTEVDTDTTTLPKTWKNSSMIFLELLRIIHYNTIQILTNKNKDKCNSTFDVMPGFSMGRGLFTPPYRNLALHSIVSTCSWSIWNKLWKTAVSILKNFLANDNLHKGACNTNPANSTQWMEFYCLYYKYRIAGMFRTEKVLFFSF